jgi:hypothetical protein
MDGIHVEMTRDLWSAYLRLDIFTEWKNAGFARAMYMILSRDDATDIR